MKLRRFLFVWPWVKKFVIIVDFDDFTYCFFAFSEAKKLAENKMKEASSFFKSFF